MTKGSTDNTWASAVKQRSYTSDNYCVDYIFVRNNHRSDGRADSTLVTRFELFESEDS